MGCPDLKTLMGRYFLAETAIRGAGIAIPSLDEAVWCSANIRAAHDRRTSVVWIPCRSYSEPLPHSRGEIFSLGSVRRGVVQQTDPSTSKSTSGMNAKKLAKAGGSGLSQMNQVGVDVPQSNPTPMASIQCQFGHPTSVSVWFCGLHAAR